MTHFMDNEQIRKRIKEVLKLRNKSIRAIALETGNQQKTFNEQINGEVRLGIAPILSILSTFPDISAEWLLRGDGDMIKGQSSGEHIEGNCNATHGATVIGNTVTTGTDAEVENRYLREQVADLKKDKEMLTTLLMAFQHGR